MNQNFKRAHIRLEICGFRALQHQMHETIPMLFHVWLCVCEFPAYLYILFRWPINIIYSEWHRESIQRRDVVIFMSFIRVVNTILNLLIFTPIYFYRLYLHTTWTKILAMPISNSTHDMEKWGSFICCVRNDCVRKTRKFPNQPYSLAESKYKRRMRVKNAMRVCYCLWNWLNEFRVRCYDDAECAIQSEPMKSFICLSLPLNDSWYRYCSNLV